MGPDYAKYDVTQLRQALGSIDSARFPARAEEIKVRLAALEHSAHVNPPVAPLGPDRSLDLPILQRVGTVMIAIGVIDICAMIYFVSNGQSYSSSFNIFGLIAGILLRRGGLRTASLVRWLACTMLPATALMGLGFLAMQPSDLTVTEVRLYPGTSFISTAFFIGYAVLLIWLFRELGRAPVLAARAAAGRPLRNMRIPFALGVIGSIAGAMLMVYLLGGARANRAETMAAAKLGAGYRYHTSSMNVITSNGDTAVTALVVAWNEKSVINVPVYWQE